MSTKSICEAVILRGDTRKSRGKTYYYVGAFPTREAKRFATNAKKEGFVSVMRKEPNYTPSSHYVWIRRM
jgi:RPA family protein